MVVAHNFTILPPIPGMLRTIIITMAETRARSRSPRAGLDVLIYGASFLPRNTYE